MNPSERSGQISKPDGDVERHQITNGELAVDNPLAADGEHRNQPQRRDQLDGGDVAGPDPMAASVACR